MPIQTGQQILASDVLQAFPECIVVFPVAYRSIVQGTWVVVHGTYGYFDIGLYNSSEVNGDSFTINVPMRAGTYTIDMYSAKETSFGIVDIDIDGVEVASFDCYGADVDFVFTDAGNVIATTSLKEITVRVDGKNGSSSSWGCVISAIIFRRTA